jgi:hypothetical protein
MPVVLALMVQGKGITAKPDAGFCFRAAHQRGMAATRRDNRCEPEADIGRNLRYVRYPSDLGLHL